jgi:hypothetical protein
LIAAFQSIIQHSDFRDNFKRGIQVVNMNWVWLLWV